jgi:uncharacterized protein YcaQ
MSRNHLSITEARRTALAAQGFDKPRPSCVPHQGHIRQVIGKLGALQLDFVNVLVPAHYLVVYSRLGPYDREQFNKLVYQGRDFIEHWAHEASIVPVEHWPHLKYRRDDFKPWPNSPIMKLRGKTKYLSEVLQQVTTKGALSSNELPKVAGPKRKPGDWHRSVPRWALEVHFGKGEVSVADRLPNFQRVYDLPERIIDEPLFSTQVSRHEGQRALLGLAAAAHGVATLHDLADYFRMSAKDAAPRVDELAEEGVLQIVTVEGWNEPAYLHRKCKIPKSIAARSLLSPFDPVVWFRPRAERLFDFHYRIEIYVPESKRKWGYYVLPFLMDDRIVARVDLKADRQASALLVKAAHPEAGIDTEKVTAGLAMELRTLTEWLGLNRIKVSRKGTFARALGDHLKAQI